MSLSLIRKLCLHLGWRQWWLILALVVGLAGGTPLRGEGPIPAAWFEKLPAEGSLAEIRAMAAREGWQRVADALFQGAKQAYLQDRLDLASAWLNVARWGGLFAEEESHFIERWVAAINQARVGHPNMARDYTSVPGRTLGDFASPELQRWLLANRGFSDIFFEQLSPCDSIPEVLRILGGLLENDRLTFETYASLALAVALVYDVPPPPGWPHAQVSEAVLPRRLPTPSSAFGFLVAADRSGRTLHRLAHLPTEQLKHVVDFAAPLAELTWAQSAIQVPLARLAATYEAVRYRLDRVSSNEMIWPGSTYDLATVLATGGICVDQAYVATQVGKARGVPTMIFRGAGLDGRHAWFGFLDGNRRWQMDAGRFAEQKFVTGLAHDPQTWGDLSDHEIQFLSEGFRLLPRFRQAQTHAGFASAALGMRDLPAARQAARKAINYESRHVEAWEILLTSLRLLKEDPRVVEASLREASIAFQRYPDLQLRFAREVSDSLRARGETSAADYEERLLARKNQGQRVDLAIDQMASELARALEQQPAFEQMRLFRGAVEQFGRGAGMDFLDRIVRPFVRHWVKAGRSAEAARALEHVRLVMAPPAGSQLEKELLGLVVETKR